MCNLLRLAAVFGIFFLSGCAREQRPATVYEGDGRAMLRRGEAPAELTAMVNDSTEAYRRFLDKKPDAANKLRDEPACVAVVPDFTNTAMVVGLSGGRGIVTCKTGGIGSPWSPPSFFTISNKTLGAQLGRESSALITNVIGPEAGRRFAMGGPLDIGSSAGATAGSVSGDLAISTNTGARVYAIDRKGAFMGISLSGSTIAPDADANARYYGRSVTANDILFGNAVRMTPEARAFVDLLPI